MAIPEEKFDGNFGGLRWEEDVGGIERDESQEWLVWLWHKEWIDRRQIGSRKCVKNRRKWRIFHEWDVPLTVLSDPKWKFIQIRAQKNRLTRGKISYEGICRSKFYLFFYIFWGFGYKIHAPRSKLEEDVGGIESQKWRMIPGKGWYCSGIGSGHTRGNVGRENEWKSNKIKDFPCLGVFGLFCWWNLTVFL